MPKKKEQVAEMFDSVTDGLKQLYRAKVRPIEELYRFGDFYSPLLTDGDFEAKPMVLLMGQYSVGKTSFIRYLLGRDFPGQHIGPEPTTDRFIAVMHGNEDKSTPGNALRRTMPIMPFILSTACPSSSCSGTPKKRRSALTLSWNDMALNAASEASEKQASRKKQWSE